MTELDRVIVDWELQIGYLALAAEFPVAVPGVGEGAVDADWTAYGLTLGALPRFPVTKTLNVEPSLRLGVAHVNNDAVYSGVGELLRPFTDGVLLNWDTRAWIASLGLALISSQTRGKTDTRFTVHVVHSQIASFVKAPMRSPCGKSWKALCRGQWPVGECAGWASARSPMCSVRTATR